MVITDIITEFGAYYLNNGQNLSRLYQILRAPSDTEKVLSTFVTDETVWQASKAGIGKVLQPFQKGWTPKGQATFTPLKIELFKQKADAEEYPDDLEGSWLGFLADGNLDRKEWPFIRWFVEQMFLPQIKEDMELDAIYWGKYKAPTAGTAGETFESMNGLRVGINKSILDGVTPVIPTGAWDADDAVFVEQIEAFADAINSKYWNIPMLIALNPTLKRRFDRGYKAKYGQYTDYRENQNGAVDMTNLSVIGLHSMTASDKIWCTTPENAKRLIKKTQNMNATRIENVDRLVKMFTDFWSGVGFVLGELIFTNDLDLGEPVISAVTPLTAGTAGGATITVTGRDFTGTTAVKLGTTDATEFTVVNDRQLTFVTPAVAGGSYNVNITNAYGTTQSADQVVVS